MNVLDENIIADQRLLLRGWRIPTKNLSEAHAMLSTIYTWFTEGFDTKDLQKAQMLLGSLTPESA